MRRPRIKRTTEQIETPEGDVYLLRPRDGNDIKIEKPDGDERRLLEALDGDHTLQQLQEEFGAGGVDTAVAQMLQLGVVEDASNDELLEPGELERFDRQLRYFSDI